MKILVVEDDKGIASGLRITLQHRGYTVSVCDSIAVAWTALRDEPFDMVLLDLGLPDGDGSDLLRRVRAAGTDGARLPDPTTPVLIMTARERVADRILGLNQGADDYLVKPFDVDELEARIRALMRRTSSRSSNTAT
jgi:DNA-binding response OmpR family regulator